MSQFTVSTTGQENRFRRVGRYDWDTLLKDLRDMESELFQLVTGVNQGQLIGPPGPPGQRGLTGTPGKPGEPGPEGEPGVFDPSAIEVLQADGFVGTYQQFVQILNLGYDLLTEFEDPDEDVPPGESIFRQRYDFGYLGVNAGLITTPPLAEVNFGTIPLPAEGDDSGSGGGTSPI